LCNDHVCFFGATELGLCAQVNGEIRRGPLVADILVSLASSALGTKWYRPPLPESLRPHAKAFFAKLPAIRVLTKFTTDAELKRSLGEVNSEILRFILMSNRCHLLERPPDLKMKQFANETEQWLSVNGALELELCLQQKLKSRRGSGSGTRSSTQASGPRKHQRSNQRRCGLLRVGRSLVNCRLCTHSRSTKSSAQ
jgi:hypothetical protein